MLFRNRHNRRNIPLCIGLSSLALANAGRLFHPAGLSVDFQDALVGFLYGISIVLLVLALRRKNRRQCAASNNDPAAS